MPDIRLSRFSADVSPPLGHPLCGGWITPVVGQDDPLELRGVMIEGSGDPIVLAAVDWTGVGDDSHRIWTERLAEAAATSPDRVSLHCVHQHNAPFVDRVGNEILRSVGAEPLLYDDAFFDRCVEKSAAALRESRRSSTPIDRLSVGHAAVREVASNRRVLGPDGKIKYVRTSSTTDPAARAEPEGTIDPNLESVGFLSGDRVIARLYFYATHPMSYYGDGRVSADFVGLARSTRDRDEPGASHLYFTGCGGNVTAGKYNDGAHENRAILAGRVHAAMKEADDKAEIHPLENASWCSSPFLFSPREDLDFDRVKSVVADKEQPTSKRNTAAMTCAWLKRLESGRPISLASLDLGPVRTLHLPAETFIEYQLYACGLNPDQRLATAAYADGGPWYIPLERSFDEGGYEPTVAWVSRKTEPLYRAAIAHILQGC